MIVWIETNGCHLYRRKEVMIYTATNVRSALESLMDICRDGSKGYETAASAVKDPSLKAELMQYSMQRDEFALQLEDSISAMGEPAWDHGSIAGSLHRAWIGVKGALTSHDSHAVLSECERGEDSAVEAYQQAISHDLPSPVRDMVELQYDAVRRVHDRIKSLRDASKKS
jgi:uncharacterized protein (TIGR02284 family)